MTQAAYELPTLKEELSRKALDTLEGLMVKRSHKEITRTELSMSLDTLFSAVSGLVEEDFLDLITMAGEDMSEMFTEAEIENASLINQVVDLQNQLDKAKGGKGSGMKLMKLEAKNSLLEKKLTVYEKALRTLKKRKEKSV